MGNRIPTDDLLDALRELGGENPPTAPECRENGKHHVKTYQQRFGTWNEALKAAGYGREQLRERDIPDEKLLDDLRAVGGQAAPTQPEYDENGKYDVTTYRRRFESWFAALEEAGYDTSVRDQRMPEESEQITYRGGWRKARERALERDDYECQDCGLSNAEHQEMYGQALRVHHIIRYRTFDDPEAAHALWNLLTLCCRCHVERHNVHLRGSYGELKEEFAETVGCAPGSG